MISVQAKRVRTSFPVHRVMQGPAKRLRPKKDPRRWWSMAGNKLRLESGRIDLDSHARAGAITPPRCQILTACKEPIMRNLVRFLSAALVMTLLFAMPGSAAERAHRVAIQVDQNDPDVMN